MHGTLGDIWIFNTGDRTWITPVAEGKPPCPREMHTGTMVTDGRLLVFGGRSPAGQVQLTDIFAPFNWSCNCNAGLPKIINVTQDHTSAHSTVRQDSLLTAQTRERGQSLCK